MPMLSKMSGAGDGVPANQPNAARVPSMMLIGVGSALTYLRVFGMAAVLFFLGG